MTIKQLLSRIPGIPLYTNALYLMLNSIATSLLGFIFWSLMTARFPPAEVGVGSTLVTSSMLLGTIANLGLGAGLVRFVPGEEQENQLINSAFTLVAAVSLLASLIYLSSIHLWLPSLRFISENTWLSLSFML
ncbi:MAG TPA: oligosaccharide flippase family protein, partial [Bacillota bacterium]|nr:oligosaccharide flippase family protein [Bacillota bacterium]